jgi:YggT family protein
MSPLSNAGFFLVNVIFDSYIFILLVRIILAYMRADYFNPMTQFFIRLTQPIILPLRKIIPNVKGIELSTLLVAFVLELVKFSLLALMLNKMPAISGIFLLGLADLIRGFINIFFYAILIQALMSWVQPGYSPLGELLTKITTPIMRPFHRLIPQIGGVDISPIPAMIFLQLLIILVVSPMYQIGQAMVL